MNTIAFSLKNFVENKELVEKRVRSMEALSTECRHLTKVVESSAHLLLESTLEKVDFMASESKEMADGSSHKVVTLKRGDTALMKFTWIVTKPGSGLGYEAELWIAVSELGPRHMVAVRRLQHVLEEFNEVHHSWSCPCPVAEMDGKSITAIEIDIDVKDFMGSLTGTSREVFEEVILGLAREEA